MRKMILAKIHKNYLKNLAHNYRMELELSGNNHEIRQTHILYHQSYLRYQKLNDINCRGYWVVLTRTI